MKSGLGKLVFENIFVLKLLDHGVVVIDFPLLDKLKLAVIEEVFDGDLSVIVFEEVVESYRSFEANEGLGNLVGCRTVFDLLTFRGKSARQSLPRTSGRINLVWLVIILVFEMIVIVIDGRT